VCAHVLHHHTLAVTYTFHLVSIDILPISLRFHVSYINDDNFINSLDISFFKIT
jgi:hypothetical protein